MKNQLIERTEKFESASVAVTALSETDSLRRAVEIVKDTCAHEDIKEIIIVLARISSEECIKTAEALCREYADVPVKMMFQERKFIGGAFQDAFEACSGSHVVMLAADMDTDPRKVCEFIEQSKMYPDRVITATRWKKGGGFVGYSKIKKVCNFIFNRFFALFYLTKLSDMTYGFRLLPVKVVKEIKWEEEKHPFYLETALKPLRLGVKFIEVPAVWTACREGESVNSFFQTFKYFRPAFANRFKKKKNMLADRTDMC